MAKVYIHARAERASELDGSAGRVWCGVVQCWRGVQGGWCILVCTCAGVEMGVYPNGTGAEWQCVVRSLVGGARRPPVRCGAARRTRGLFERLGNWTGWKPEERNRRIDAGSLGTRNSQVHAHAHTGLGLSLTCGATMQALVGLGCSLSSYSLMLVEL